MQESLFDNFFSDSITQKDVAKKLNVSEATIHNWVKTGYLKRSRAGLLCANSLSDFEANILGREKLTQRANKSRAQSHNHDGLAKFILQEVWTDLSDKTKGAALAVQYERALSNSHKNQEGIYYTPHFVCTDLVSRINMNGDTRFCDPCCGTGNFLLAALEAGVRTDNLFGFDTDGVAVEIAKRRIFDVTGYRDASVMCLDFLASYQNFAQDKFQNKFDVILTNPPWGKKQSHVSKNKLATKFGCNKSTDTSVLFMMAAMQCLKHGGMLGLLLPESFFNVATFVSAREILLRQKIKHLINYDKIFDGLLVKAQAFLCEVDTAGARDHKIICETFGTKSSTVAQQYFQTNPFAIFNFTATPQELAVLSRMIARPHETLANKARWGLGIVTGHNARHVLNAPADNTVPIYKGTDLKRGAFVKPSHFILDDFSNFQQTAPRAFYDAPKKLVYKFISSDLVFCCDTEQRLLLNSLNFVIVDEQQLPTMEKLAAYFNLDIINWFHKKLFGTYKILRSNLERVPIYDDYIENNQNLTDESFCKFLGLERTNGTYRIKE